MVRAAMARKCARFCQATLSCPSRQRQASFTKAVGWRVWPGGSLRRYRAAKRRSSLYTRGMSSFKASASPPLASSTSSWTGRDSEFFAVKVGTRHRSAGWEAVWAYHLLDITHLGRFLGYSSVYPFPSAEIRSWYNKLFSWGRVEPLNPFFSLSNKDTYSRKRHKKCTHFRPTGMARAGCRLCVPWELESVV